MKSRSAHCIRGCTPGAQVSQRPCREPEARSGAIEPAWKCREASWPRARSSELTDQAVTIRGSSWLRPSQSPQMLPGSPLRAAFHTDGGCLQQSGCVGDNFGGRVSSSCWQACPLLCTCRVICAVSPGKGAELQVHVHCGARWWLAGLTSFSGALCAGGAVFTDGLLRNTRQLTHKRPVLQALWVVNVGLSQERLVG